MSEHIEHGGLRDENAQLLDMQQKLDERIEVLNSKIHTLQIVCKQDRRNVEYWITVVNSLQRINKEMQDYKEQAIVRIREQSLLIREHTESLQRCRKVVKRLKRDIRTGQTELQNEATADA